MAGFKNDLPNEEDVIIAAFDAATTGRLSLVYYNELKASDFLKELIAGIIAVIGIFIKISNHRCCMI